MGKLPPVTNQQSSSHYSEMLHFQAMQFRTQIYLATPETKHKGEKEESSHYLKGIKEMQMHTSIK